MTVKLTGADFKAFMDDKTFWFDGRWYHDGALSVNGGEWFDWDGEEIAPNDKLRWQGGELYDTPDGRTFFDLEAKLRAWLKARTVTTIVIQVERNCLADVLLQLDNMAGVKVLS